MRGRPTRRKAALSRLVGTVSDYAACGAIGAGVASVFGLSWLLGFTIVVVAFKSWKKKHPFLSGHLRVLTISTFCLLSLAGNYSAYCEGVSAGFDAAERVGKDRANQTLQGTPAKAPSSSTEPASRRS